MRRAQGTLLGMFALGMALSAISCEQTPATMGPESVAPVENTELPATFEAMGPYSYVGKVKNVLTGLPPSDAELLAVQKDETALRGLIDDWMKTPQFRTRMLAFFATAFQQGQLNRASLLDMVPDAPIGDRMLGNIMASFPLTVWQLTMVEGKPLTEALTTERFMMTPPLATLLAFLDNRYTTDANRGTDYITTANPNFKITLSNKSGPIAIEKTLDPQDPLFMNWYLPIAVPAACTDPLVYPRDTPRLYQFLFGSVNASTGVCTQSFAVPSQFADAEYDAWRMVQIRQPKAGEASSLFYDLTAMRNTGELVLRVPRVGFFTTPAFFANWATNASNQARVTINQTLIVALGRSFDDSNNTLPLALPAMDKAHSSDPACYPCHKTLDPMRQVFRQAYTLTYHEQKDPAQTSMPGVFAFDGISKNVSTPKELGQAMAGHPRFAVAWAQKLCYFANSAACSESDPEFQRIVMAFQSSGHDLKTLLREVLTSPLTTGTRNTQTFADQGMTLSVARRDQLCGAMSTRLGVPNLCALGRAPSLAQLIPSDGFSRGGTAPILATDPSLFYRAATEQLCRNFADYVVDSNVTGKPSRYQSKLPDAAISDMVQTVMGVVPSDPRYGSLLAILSEHYAKASKTQGITGVDALKSTFTLACMSPTSLSLGL